MLPIILHFCLRQQYIAFPTWREGMKLLSFLPFLSHMLDLLHGSCPDILVVPVCKFLPPVEALIMVLRVASTLKNFDSLEFSTCISNCLSSSG